MSRFLKLLVSCAMVVTLLFSLSINTFAATYSCKNIASFASQELMDVTCNYYSLKKDSFTVKNNGTISMIVHVNGRYVATIAPGASYTCKPNHHFKDRVQVYAKTRAAGQNQKIYITSTSGVIYRN